MKRKWLTSEEMWHTKNRPGYWWVNVAPFGQTPRWVEEPEFRCFVTNNPCGTDTWPKDRPCQCCQCQQYLANQKRRVRVKRGTP